MLKRFFNAEVKPHKDAWFVIGCVLIFGLLRLPSLSEPYWYGDEGIYQVIGKAIQDGRVLYQDIWDNKPPLLYYIYALFNGEQFFVRLFSFILGGLSVIAFYFLGKKIFQKKISVIVSTTVYALFFGLPIIEGNIANAENIMHLPILVSALLLFFYLEKRREIYIVLSGVILSFAFAIKIVAIFEFSAFIIFLFLFKNPSFKIAKIHQFLNFKKMQAELLFFVGFISLLGVFGFYFFLLHAFPDFLSGVFSENIDYVGAGNNLVFPMGILFIKIAILVGVVCGIYIWRKKLTKAELFIFLWLAFGLFSTFFSQRAYLHYVLMSLIPVCLLIGNIIDSPMNRIGKIIVLFGVLGILYFNFGIYKKTISYYGNYFAFITNDKPIGKYQAFFDSNTPRDYELARFIRELKEEGETVFVWTDSAQIYALSETLPPGKYIVAYHITYYNNAIDTMREKVLEQNPRYIIKTKDSKELNMIIPSYSLKYRISDASIYERQN